MTIWRAIADDTADQTTTVADGLRTEIKTAGNRLAELKNKRFKSVTVAKRESLYGFSVEHEEHTELVEDPVTKEDITVAAKTIKSLGLKFRKVSTYPRQAADLARQLSGQGLPLIAVVPAGLFDSIVRRYGVRRFEHLDEYGRTGIAVTRLHAQLQAFPAHLAFLLLGCFMSLTVNAPAWWHVWSLPAIASAVFIIGQFDSGRVNPEPGPAAAVSVILLFMAYCIVMIVGGIVCASAPDGLSVFSAQLALVPGRAASLISFAWFVLPFIGLAVASVMRFERYETWALYLLPKRWLYALIWPHGLDRPIPEEKDRQDEAVNVRFQVDQAGSFIETIEALRQADLHPCVAVDPEVIKLDRRELANAVAAVRKNADPIVYTRHGDFIAVHLQVGEFASEAAVMAFVRAEGLIPQFLHSL